MFPHQKPPAWLKAVTAAYLIWQLPAGKNRVYLTFDDGPHPEVTLRLMATLQLFNARATFFVQGEKVVRHATIVEALLHNGHGLGSHGWSHLDGWATKRAAYLENIAKLGELYPLHLFRPPYGRITPCQVAELRRKKIKTVMWSLSTMDYNQRVNPATSLEFLKSQITDGSIILMHDSSAAEPSLMQILPGMLDFLAHRGYNTAVLPGAFMLEDFNPKAKFNTFAE